MDDQGLNPSSNISNLLSEENFGSNETSVRPRIRTLDVRSPEDHTLRNVDDLLPDQSPTREHFPQENQQPIESEAEEGFSEHPVNSRSRTVSTDADLIIIPPGVLQPGHSVDEILSELSMTDNEGVVRQNSIPVETEEFSRPRALPQLPVEPSFHSNNARDMMQNEIEDAMRDLEPRTIENRREDDETGHVLDRLESDDRMRSGNDSAIGGESRQVSGDGYASDESSESTQVARNRNPLDTRAQFRESAARRSRRSRTHSHTSEVGLIVSILVISFAFRFFFYYFKFGIFFGGIVLINLNFI